ncbi:MAG: hypothetical protein EA421_13170 [Gemmatimonadales bacterium]|nr:MAG: hypothetical protein EA421_13170 [Gemmatimonadales bacterium]
MKVDPGTGVATPLLWDPEQDGGSMRRRSFLFALPLIALFALMGCESSTDIQDISATGSWDGVGPLQQAYSGLRLELEQQPNGNVSGQWWFAGGTRFSVTGTNNAGNLELTFSNFPTGTAQFQGQFTHDFRMEGTLNGANLTGAAVFRRTSF